MGWTCLMYHDVCVSAPRNGSGPDRFAVTLAAFERQLDWLVREGLRGCTIAEAIARPAGCVAISFDDGTAGSFERALPALSRRGMTATFFVTTAWVGRPGYVTWDQLREMKVAGMSIQSHTRTHPFLSELTEDALLEELCGSKAELDAALRQDTDAIALPGGDEPRRHLRHLLAKAGYSVVATSRWGRNGPAPRPAGGAPVRIRRCTVRGDPSRDRFLSIVRGGPWTLGWNRARGAVLNGVRSGLGPRRYSRWRRSVLESLRAVR